MRSNGPADQLHAQLSTPKIRVRNPNRPWYASGFQFEGVVAAPPAQYLDRKTVMCSVASLAIAKSIRPSASKSPVAKP